MQHTLPVLVVPVDMAHFVLILCQYVGPRNIFRHIIPLKVLAFFRGRFTWPCVPMRCYIAVLMGPVKCMPRCWRNASTIFTLANQESAKTQSFMGFTTPISFSLNIFQQAQGTASGRPQGRNPFLTRHSHFPFLHLYIQTHTHCPFT